MNHFRKSLLLLCAVLPLICNAEKIKIDWQCKFDKGQKLYPFVMDNNYNYAKWKNNIKLQYCATTSENTRGSGKAFKIDLTFKKAAKFCYFRMKLPKAFHIQNPLYLSGYMKITSNPGLDIQLGRTIRWQSPSGQEGCGPLGSNKTPDGWLFFQQNLYQYVNYVCTKSPKKKYGWKTDTNYVNSIVLLIRGKIKAGDKVTLYISDLKLSTQKVKMQLDKTSASTAKLTLLGQRKRYEVRNKIFLAKCSGNAIKNSSFELGLKDWDINNFNSSQEPFVKASIDQTTAQHGKKSLKIVHSAPVQTALYRTFLPVNKKHTVTFYAKGNGDIKVAGKKVAKEWQKYTCTVHEHWKFKGFYFTTIQISGKGTVWIDAVETTKNASHKFAPLNEVEIGFSVNNNNSITNVFSENEKISLDLNVFNGTGKPQSATIKYTVKDFYHNIIKQSQQEVNLSADMGQTINIPLKLKRGIYWAYAEATYGKTKTDTEANFSLIKVMDSKKIPSSSILGGCQAHWMNQQRESDLSRKIGMKTQNVYGVCYFSRAPKDWREKAENGTLYGKNSSAEKYYTLATGNGIEPVFMFHGLPKWLTGGKDIHAKDFVLTDKMVKEWGDFIYATVKHFKGRVKYWEIWTELVHNDRDAENCYKLLKAAYPAAKKADPDCVIMGCGFDPGRPMVDNCRRVFKLGGLKYLDVVTLHPYFIFSHSSPEIGKIEESLQKIKALMRQYCGKEKPIWMTEISYQNTNTYYADLPAGENFGHRVLISEERMADYLARFTLIALANGVKKYLLFPTLHSGLQVYFSFYGITYGNCRSPKAGLPAFATLVDLFNDATIDKQLKLGKNFKCYIFNRKRGDAIAAIWNTTDDNFARTIVKLKNSDLKFIDLMNNPVNVTNQGLTLYGGSPCFIIGKTAKQLTEILSKASIKTLKSEAKLTYDYANNQLKLKLNNGQPTAQTAQLEFIAEPAGWGGISTKSMSVKLMPEQPKTIIVPLKKLSINTPGSLIAEVKIGEEKLTLKFRPLPCHEHPKVSSYSLNASSLAFSGKNKGVFNPKDLSAVFQSSWDKNNLYLTFNVKDNKFSQSFKGVRIWKGDSIQIAFDPHCNTADREAGFDADDQEYALALTQEGKQVYCFNGPNTGLSEQVKLDVKQTDGFITYKAEFPWKLFPGFIPRKGAMLGFNFTVMDNDGTPCLTKYLRLTKGIAGKEGKRPFYYRDLILK
jgi:hypothetical protein